MQNSLDRLDVSDSSRSYARQYGERVLILLSISYPIVLSLCYIGSIQDRMGYAYSHLFLNYSHGFARRSLYGTLFQSVPFISAKMALIIGYVQVLIVILLTYFMFVRHFLSSYRDSLLFCFLFGGCGLLPHLGLIYGYLDIPLYSLLLITVFVIRALDNHFATTLTFVSAITVVALLVHEAYLLMFYPAVFVLLLLQAKSRRSLFALLIHCAFIAGSFYLIISHGNSSIDSETYLKLAKARTNLPIIGLAFDTMRSSFQGQVIFAMRFYLIPAILLLIVVSIAVASPYLIILWTLLSVTVSESELQNNTQVRWVMKFIPFFLATPLLLTIIGFDLMRWLSCACINMTIVSVSLFCFASNRDQVKKALGRITGSDRFLAALLATIIIGPFGIVLGNRISETLFGCGSRWFCV